MVRRMCAGCISSVDTYVYAAVGAGAAAEAALGRLRAVFDPLLGSERRVRIWERDAEFCSSVGLDPTRVLGPKPAPERVVDTRWLAAPRPRGLALT